MSGATLNMTVAAAALVTAGKYAQDEGFEIKIAAGAAIAALGLSLLENVDEHLAQLFAGAILLTAAFLYVPVITDKLGYTGGKSGNSTGTKGVARLNKVTK